MKYPDFAFGLHFKEKEKPRSNKDPPASHRLGPMDHYILTSPMTATMEHWNDRDLEAESRKQTSSDLGWGSISQWAARQTHGQGAHIKGQGLWTVWLSCCSKDGFLQLLQMEVISGERRKLVSSFVFLKVLSVSTLPWQVHARNPCTCWHTVTPTYLGIFLQLPALFTCPLFPVPKPEVNNKREWLKLEIDKKEFYPIPSPSPMLPHPRPEEKDGSFLCYKSKSHSLNVVIVAPSLTWQAWGTRKVYILKKTFRLASCFVWKTYDSVLR